MLDRFIHDEKSDRMETEEMLLAYLSGKGEAEAYRTGFNEALERVHKFVQATGVDVQVLKFLDAQFIAPLQGPLPESSPES
jgi:hypothetical protein